MSRLRRILSPARYIRRAAIKRGVRGQSSFWRVAWALLLGRELLGRSPVRRGARRYVPFWPQIVAFQTLVEVANKLLVPPAEVVAIERLDPGEFVRVEAIERE